MPEHSSAQSTTIDRVMVPVEPSYTEMALVLLAAYLREGEERER